MISYSITHYDIIGKLWYHSSARFQMIIWKVLIYDIISSVNRPVRTIIYKFLTSKNTEHI